MARASVFFAVLLVLASNALAAAPGIPPRSFDEWQCAFHRDLSAQGGKKWSWDLNPLRQSRKNEYSIAYGSDPNVLFTFNLCGTISEVCAPYDVEKSGILPPLTHGIAIQYLDSELPPADAPNCTDTNTCDFASDPACTASTVQSVKCTAACEVIAPYTGAAPAFTLWDESNAKGGITLSYQGALPYATDPFGACPIDPRTGFPSQRSFTVNLACDPKAPATDLINMVYSELSPCQYAVNASTSAACPKPGDVCPP